MGTCRRLHEVHQWTLRNVCYAIEAHLCRQSMSRRYRLGGDLIDVGLSTLRVIDRKTENSCEIKKCAGDQSRIILRLEVVKSSFDENVANRDARVPHGTAVMTRLVGPWTNTYGMCWFWCRFCWDSTCAILDGNVLYWCHRSCAPRILS